MSVFAKIIKIKIVMPSPLVTSSQNERNGVKIARKGRWEAVYYWQFKWFCLFLAIACEIE